MIALHGSVSYSIFGIRDRINAPMPMRRSDVWCPAGGFQSVLDQFWVHKRRRRKSEPKKFKKKIVKEKMRIGSDNQKKHGDMVGQSISMGGL